MTSQELLDAGIKPCALFKELLSCNSIEEAQTKYSQFIGTKQVKEKLIGQGLFGNGCVLTIVLRECVQLRALIIKLLTLKEKMA